MPRKLVLREDGTLAAVVESYQQVEIAQLEAEVEAKQTVADGLKSQYDGIGVQLTEAEAALEDSKSELEDGKKLVDQPTDDQGSSGVDSQVESEQAQY